MPSRDAGEAITVVLLQTAYASRSPIYATATFDALRLRYLATLPGLVVAGRYTLSLQTALAVQPADKVTLTVAYGGLPRQREYLGAHADRSGATCQRPGRSPPRKY